MSTLLSFPCVRRCLCCEEQLAPGAVCKRCAAVAVAFAATETPAPAVLTAQRAVCACGAWCEIGETVCARCIADRRLDALRGELVAGDVMRRRILFAMIAGGVVGFAIYLAFAL